MRRGLRITVRLPRLRARVGFSRRARMAFLLLFAVALSLGVRSVFGAKGLLEGWRLRAEGLRLEAEVSSLRRQLAAERRQIRELRAGGVAVERIARERLGMVKPGEVVFLLQPDPAAAPEISSEGGEAAPSP